MEGKILKTLFGNPNADDAAHYEKVMKALENNEIKNLDLLKKQTVLLENKSILDLGTEFKDKLVELQNFEELESQLEI